jgi:exodeoxyribonuclease VII large subunit
VTVFPALVQGAEAPQSLRDALVTALARGDCDILLITRGGGSVEDLAAFNDEALARMIAAAEVPIVSAVGHEIDFSISDFVADRRAPTPSAAAELISPDSSALSSKVDAYRRRLDRVLRRQAIRRQQQLDQLSGRLQRAAPANRLRQQQQQLDRLDVRLSRSVRARLASHRERTTGLHQRLLRRSPAQVLLTLEQRRILAGQRLRRAGTSLLERRQERLAATVRQLQALSPLATMQRGYSILRRPQDGAVVTSVGDLDVGAPLQGLLRDGSVDLEVQSVSPDPITSD